MHVKAPRSDLLVRALTIAAATRVDSRAGSRVTCIEVEQAEMKTDSETISSGTPNRIRTGQRKHPAASDFDVRMFNTICRISSITENVAHKGAGC